MEMTQLPPVAQKVFQFCKKCDCERYHVVLTHTDSQSAKLECEVCKKKSTLSIKKKKKTTKPRKAAAPKVSSAEKWTDLVAGHSGPSSPYNQKTKYSSNTKIEHARFGVGLVTTVVGNQMEVVFQEGIKSLIHNRV
jgi:hypothetical protein